MSKEVFSKENKSALLDITKYQLIEIEKLVGADWNYKKEDENGLLETLRNNIKRNGQIENIIVRELDTGFYEVCNGNHRLKVFQELQMPKAICYNLGKISLAEAKRLTIETNETKFKADSIRLAETVTELLNSFSVDELAETMPYSADEITNFKDILDFDWKDKPSGDVDTTPPSSDEWKELKFNLPLAVAEQFEYQLQRFKQKLCPDDNPKDVSYVMPIEAMIQCVAQIPDEQLM